MPLDSPELMIVVPVFNEQASVRKVVIEWFQEIENWTEHFVFLVINDGSTDGTAVVLSRLRERLGLRLEIMEHENRGHGQTCLRGYRLAIERRIPFILQIDSDGQCDPQYFVRFWRMRHDFDVIYGRRVRRHDGWRRVLASLILQWTLLLAQRIWCVDSNVPYRLMRSEILAHSLERIGPDFVLANVALAVVLRRKPGVRQGSVAIRFRERYGGEPSVSHRKIWQNALELLAQLQTLS